jgi:hypothetical protein
LSDRQPDRGLTEITCSSSRAVVLCKSPAIGSKPAFLAVPRFWPVQDSRPSFLVVLVSCAVDLFIYVLFTSLNTSANMGKLIKNHWARLIVLTAATYQVAASIQGFFWPKIFWDFLTKNLDGAVKPFPTLQIINLILAFVGLAWEWPLAPLVKMLPGMHRSIEARLVVYPLSALAGVLMYQSTNAALYYLIGVVIYFWAFCEGEVSSNPSLRCTKLINS